MRAVIIVDNRLEVADRPDPVPGTGELLVRIRATGVNNADLVQRSGGYPAPPGSPADIPGLELAGEVEALGPDVFRFGLGDRVMAVVGGGAHAELAVVHERHAMPVPDDVAWEVAGGFAEAYITAHDSLFTQCRLRSGERVLVTGAAGGVGIAAVQLATAAGARVVASVRDPQRRAEVSDGYGVKVIAPAELAGSGPFDVVMEMFPRANLDADLSELALLGRVGLVSIGGGPRVEIDAWQIIQRRAQITGASLRGRSLEDKAIAARRVEREVLPLLEAGRVGVPVFATFALSDADAAYERFAAGGKLGKIVLLP